ncbi:MAG: DUF294 nucleotidyltransferase-like domain-containing protein, partial [Desulfobacterales bacterium]|nr:DUF294 nucleotidyltransferase-like domain-containing protein [Desulfobacterales bacterium]
YLHSMVRSGIPLHRILTAMSHGHEAVCGKVISLCEVGMEREGKGRPPVAYCWVNMGSEGRREQALRTDQDNALIHADPRDGELEAVDEWFAEFAHRVTLGLDRCGFDLCTGRVMASHSPWRRSLSQWQTAIQGWSRSLDPDQSIMMTILLDFRPVWGDVRLAEQLWESIFTVFESPEKINHMLAREDLRFEIPMDIFGRIQPMKNGEYPGQVNIKTGGLVHLINGARIFALNHGIAETSTLGRIHQLEAQGVFTRKQAGYFRLSFETFSRLRLLANLDRLGRGEEMTNTIDPRALGGEERLKLRNAFMSASHMQKLIQNRFTQIALNFFS